MPRLPACWWSGVTFRLQLRFVQQRWVLTAAETTFGVEDLLSEGRISLAVSDPASSRLSRRLPFRVAANGSESDPCEEAPSSAGEVSSSAGSITMSGEPMRFDWTLAELCPDCSAGQPIPAIDTVREQTWVLPPEVVTVQISGGRVQLSLEHDIGFVPIRKDELQIVAVSIGNGSVPEQEVGGRRHAQVHRRPCRGARQKRRHHLGRHAAGGPRQLPDPHPSAGRGSLADDLLNGGGGVGLDLGVMLTLDRLALGAAVQNLFNPFAWNESLLTYRRVAASFADGSLDFE